MGYQMLALTIGWQIYDMSGSAFALGMVGLVQFLPTALLVFVGVVLAVGVHPIEDPSPLMSGFADNSRSSIALALRSSTRALPLSTFGIGVGAFAPHSAGIRTMLSALSQSATPSFGIGTSAGMWTTACCAVVCVAAAVVVVTGGGAASTVSVAGSSFF